MKNITPLQLSKDQLKHIISRIESDSSVGIDTQLTHGIIIAYLERLEERLNRIEQHLDLQK